MKVQIKADMEKHILEEMDKDKPSSEPKYWAKPGCKHCYGTGTIGTVSTKVGSNTIKNEQLCICASRRWQKWQDNWKEERRKRRRIEAGLEVEPTVLRDDETDQVDLEATLSKLRPRIDRIDDNIVQLRSEIFGQQRRLADMPQHAVINGFEEQIDVSRSMLESMLADVVERENSADLLDQQAQNLILMAQQKQKAAEKLRSDAQTIQNGSLKSQKTQILALETELTRTRKDLNRVSRSPKRKIRIAQQKLERLESRRRRIAINAGIDPEVIPDGDCDDDPTPENHSSL